MASTAGGEGDWSGQYPSRVRTPLLPDDPKQIGPYPVLARLGRGPIGTSFVAQATDKSLVALKLVRQDLLDIAEFMAALQREVTVAKEIDNWYAARLLDAQTDRVPVYVVTELLTAPSLSDAVDATGPIGGAELLRVGSRAALALLSLHRAELVHGDVKPSNVVLTEDGIELLDLWVGRTTLVLPRQGEGVLATLDWMAPEQITRRDLTFACDAFSLAATLAYSGTGRAPFGEDPTRVARRGIERGTPDLQGINGPVFDWIFAALSVEPESRPSLEDLIDAEMASRSGLPESMRLGGPRPLALPESVSSPRAQGRSWTRERIAAYLVVAALAIAAIVVAGVLGLRRTPNASACNASSASTPLRPAHSRPFPASILPSTFNYQGSGVPPSGPNAYEDGFSGCGSPATVLSFIQSELTKQGWTRVEETATSRGAALFGGSLSSHFSNAQRSLLIQVSGDNFGGVQVAVSVTAVT